MINEVVEVKSYLEGKNINKKNLYRVCYMLAKWYKEQGYTHVEIRKAIFDWGKVNEVYIKYNLNNIIYKALDDKTRLKDNITIKVNKRDIEEIRSRFDSKNTKLAALAILCYAKTWADRDKKFSLSSVALSCWIQVDAANLGKRHIQELVDFGYLTKVSTPQNSYKWDNADPNCQYIINVDIHNSGEYELKDNSIMDLYSQIFF